ncbi:MAG: PTS sugar transporter subunit IIA [Myxococcales bacterium]|nr:PTS sugar transporter subunit IIA [Myxococcales bacterium]
MLLAELLGTERVSLSLEAADKPSALLALSRLFEGGGADVDRVYRALMARESLASTGVGSGVAIPHGRVPGIDGIQAALGIHREGIPFDAVDGERVHVFVAILAPEDKPSQHLKALAEVSRVLRRRDVREKLLSVDSAEDALLLLR